MIRLLIADDHSLIREGLRKVFSREAGMELVAEACDAAEAVALVRAHDIDVAILDLNMPGRSGLDAIAAIHAIKPKLPILILSMIQQRDIALRVFKAGGVGFVSKESAAEEIVTAVRQAAAGKKYVSAAVAEQLAEGLGMQAEGLPHDALSDRELMVLRLIASGQGTRNIAEQLSLSVNTIATYRRRIMEKLGLRSDVEIARYAIKHQLSD
ncbi:response regulator transcription factor [Pseudomaricurvus alcaniphilus]|uniref:response regulator n=1 Tax=Pseudomaricurvus alcaniphilus TaxID=1166482 RepID=UPI00140872F4|nr:response regulator transcription factor [Pseudomaricurvus alcaniphilus]NHN36256.1 response regulator transcription factor [Pseudomaricurvus alcaniphilus]